MPFRHLLASLVCLVFLTTFSIAEEAKRPDLSQPLTLQQCTEIAMQYSSTIRNARTSLELSQLRVQDAKAAYLPEIDVSGRYQFSDQVDFGWERQNYDASVRGSYLLWDHGQREANLGQAKSSHQLTQAQFDRIQLNLIFDVTRAYYNVLKSKELVKVDQELLRQAKGNTDRVRAFRDAGSLIDADVANAELNEANRELNLLNDQNALDVAMATLPTLLGLDPGTSVNVAEDPDYAPYINGKPLVMSEQTIEEAIQSAFEQRPERVETQARLESLDWALTLAQLQRWPRLTASYDYNVLLDDYLRDRQDFKNYRSWQALATMSFPLFDGGRAKRQVEQAEKQVERELEDAAALERSIALEVRQAYLEFQRTAKSLEIANKRVRDAELNLEVQQERFNQELIILLELLDAENNYAQALTARVNAFYDYKVAQSRLQKAIGEIR